MLASYQTRDLQLHACQLVFEYYALNHVATHLVHTFSAYPYMCAWYDYYCFGISIDYYHYYIKM